LTFHDSILGQASKHLTSPRAGRGVGPGLLVVGDHLSFQGGQGFGWDRFGVIRSRGNIHVAGYDQRLSTRAPPSAGRRPAAVVDRPGRSWPPGPWSWRRRRGPHGGRERRRRARDARTAAGRVDSRPAPARERRGGRLSTATFFKLRQALVLPIPLRRYRLSWAGAQRRPSEVPPARRRLAAHVPVAASLSRLGRSDRQLARSAGRQLSTARH